MSDKKAQIVPAGADEKNLFYSAEAKDAQHGTVGHLRMDTGSSGKEFWSSWWPHNGNTLTSEKFSKELDEVVNTMREPGGPLHSLQDMQGFCRKYGGDAVVEEGRSYGFKLETEDFQYMLRLTPFRGDYSYLYCYDKAAQREYAEKESVIGQLGKASEKATKAMPAPKKKQEMER